VDAPKLPTPLVVRAPGYPLRILGVMLFFELVGLFMFTTTLRSILERGAPLRLWALPAFFLVVMAAPLYFFWNRRRWVRQIDAAGIELRSGRRVSWAEVHAVRRAMTFHRGRAVPTHFEILFGRGKGLVFPAMVANAPEVMKVLEDLRTDRETAPKAPETP